MSIDSQEGSADRVAQLPIDIVLLAADWRSRVLIRAQLIEQGLEVVATEDWPTMRRQLRPGSKPRLAIVDLKDLADPEAVLRNMSLLMTPERVLVLTALGTMPPREVERFGFKVMPRPFAIDGLVRVAAAAIGTP